MRYYNRNILQIKWQWEYLMKCIVIYFFNLFLKIFYIFIWQKLQVGREIGRERGGSRLPAWAESLMQGLIPGPWDHDLSQRQRLNPLSQPGAPCNAFLKAIKPWLLEVKRKCLNVQAEWIGKDLLIIIALRKWFSSMDNLSFLELISSNCFKIWVNFNFLLILAN